MTPNPSRRRFLSLASLATAGTVGLAGCGYRPGGGDVRWEVNVGTGGYQPDDVLAGDDGTLFTVNRSSRGFDWDAEEWGQYADLTAYDATSGRERGEAQTEPVGRPAVGGRTLYVGHEDGGLTAFGADGETRWRAETDGPARGVAASADRVYAVTDGDELVAFAPDDGERLWSADSDDSGGDVALAGTVDGTYVHREATATSTEVTAFAPDGERRWSATLSAGGVGNARPVLVDDTLYVPARGSLFALDREDGDDRWSHSAGSRGSPAVADGAVYLSDGERVSALDAANGEERWRFAPEGWRARVSAPAAAEGVAYVGGRSALYALDGDGGSVRWRVDSGEVRGAPIVVGRTVVVVSRDGYLRGHWRE